MDPMQQQLENGSQYDYSFTKAFQNFSYIKKLLTLLFLPLTPIYIIPKGFQLRSWKKKGSEHPPSMIRNVTIMILLYVILQLPIYVSIFYLYLTIFLWPITILVSIYLHKRDYTKEEVVPGTTANEFKVIGFKKLSLTFVILFALTIIFTFGGILLLLTVTSLIFILFSKLYKKLYFIPKKFLFLSYSFFNFLNFIPGVYVAGEWFIEKDSEIKVLKNPIQIAKFIISNYEPFFILNVGISALLVRILVWFRHENIPDSQRILSPESLSSWGFLSIFLVVPIIMSIYFVWVWVWGDAEIKVAKAKVNQFSVDKNTLKETTLLVPVSDSIKRLFTYLFGLSPIIWLVDQISIHDFPNLPTGTVGIIIIMLFAFLFTGVSTIFMGIMYYRSGAHEYLVNRLRNEIKQLYVSGNYTIKVCNSGIRDVDPAQI